MFGLTRFDCINDIPVEESSITGYRSNSWRRFLIEQANNQPDNQPVSLTVSLTVNLKLSRHYQHAMILVLITINFEYHLIFNSINIPVNN